MLVQWEKFNGGPTKPSHEQIHITINHSGVIRLNRTLYGLMGKPAAVVLLYDKIHSTIGIQSAYPKLAEAFPVLLSDDHTLIRAAPFCRHFGIRPDRTLRFPDAAIDGDGVLRLDLKRAVNSGWRTYNRPANRTR